MTERTEVTDRQSGASRDDETTAGTLGQRWTSERVAAVAFGAYLVAAGCYVLFALDVGVWFAGDEWAFIAGRGLTVSDLLTPLQTHWSTLPILWYQGLYRVFGLEDYWPYLLSVLLLHLALCVLLRVVMRRSGVSPWVATVAAGSFVLFGPGYQNVVLGVQVSMVGSMVFGFGQVLLADHDGPIDRRDVAGVGAGILALMCSGIGPVLVVAAGVSSLIRRGWRAAAFHTVPAATVYGLWYLRYHDGADMSPMPGPPPVSAVWSWVWHGETGVLGELGGFSPVGLVLALVAVVGLGLLWSGSPSETVRRRGSMAVGLLCGAVILFASASTQRWIFGPEFARSSRYLSMATALTLPVIALGADAVVRRWRVATLPVFCLFLVGVPGNIRDFHEAERLGAFQAGQRRLLTAAAHVPYAADVPPSLRPEPSALGGDEVTMAFLLEARDQGRLPPAPEMTPALESELQVRLGLEQREGTVDARYCPEVLEPTTITVEPGDQLPFSGVLDITPVADGQALSPAIPYNFRQGGSELLVLRELPDLLVEPVPGPFGSRLCPP